MFRPVPLFIGLRYTRAKRRNHFISFISLISMLGITLGIVALIVVLSVMNGFHKEIQERILGMASHAALSAPDYGGLTDWQQLLTQVREQPHVLGAAPFIEIEAMLMNGSRTHAALLRGILPTEEEQVSDLHVKMVSGTVANLISDDFNIVLGAELAAVLGVGVGDQVMVVTPQVNATPAGIMPRLKAFTVVGIFQVGMAEYDTNAGFIALGDAARLLRLGSSVGGIRLKLDRMFDAPIIARQIAASLGTYRVTDWTQVHRNFFAALRTEKRMMSVILFLIVAVAAFNIVSTLVMVVTDKQADIAVLRTLGASPQTIMAIFMVQGTTIGLIGTVLGSVCGVILGWNVEQFVAYIEQLFGVHFLDPSIYYISRLPADVQLTDVVIIAASAFSIALLATIYPAWRAARTDPAAALRYE